MNKVRSALACALLSLAVARSTDAQDSSKPIGARNKDQLIRELMQATGAANLGRQMMEQMRTPLEKAIPDLPPAFWDEFMAQVKPDEMVDRLVPIYAKHFSAEEVSGLIQFYKTPLGRKLVAEMPDVLKESMAAGQEWGRELGERAYRRAEARRRATPSGR